IHARLRLGLVPIAPEVVFNLFEILAAVLRLRHAAVAVRRLVSLELVTLVDVRPRGEVIPQPGVVRGWVDLFADRLPDHAADDAARRGTDGRADRSPGHAGGHAEPRTGDCRAGARLNRVRAG